MQVAGRIGGRIVVDDDVDAFLCKSAGLTRDERTTSMPRPKMSVATRMLLASAWARSTSAPLVKGLELLVLANALLLRKARVNAD